MTSRTSALVASAPRDLQKKTKMCDIVRKNPIGRKSHSGALFSETSAVEQETRGVCREAISTPRKSANSAFQNETPEKKNEKMLEMRGGSA